MTGNTLGLSISEKERAVQIQEARRLSQLETPNPSPKPVWKTTTTAAPRPASESKPAFKKKYVPKGHDATIKDLQAKRTPIFIETINNDVIHGIIVNSDRYTISVRSDSDGSGKEFIEHFYKHGILSFGKVAHEATTELTQLAIVKND